jgi:predicted MPP superfamily phosphohydrolase
MKIPTKFFYFLGFTQIILTFCHWLLYLCLLFIFPWLIPYKHALLSVLLLLSVSFLAFSFLEFKSDNIIIGVAYTLSGLWIVAWFYLLVSSLAACLAYLITSKSFPYVTSTFFIIALAVWVYGIINARILRTVELKIKLPNLPEYWKGKTAVMVSDLHLGHVLRKGFAKKIVAKINSFSPEIVFIPGDFYDGAKTDFASLANLFKEVKSPQGIYFCSGNHEMFAGYDECETALREAGITILENEKIEVNGLQIAGVAYNRNLIQDTIVGFKGILEKLNLDKSKTSILLKHVPLQIEDVQGASINLMLSGHTHKGQVWPGSIVTKKFWKGFDYGFQWVGDLQIYTSSGAGTWGPPVKINSASEIVKITFE